MKCFPEFEYVPVGTQNPDDYSVGLRILSCKTTILCKPNVKGDVAVQNTIENWKRQVRIDKVNSYFTRICSVL